MKTSAAAPEPASRTGMRLGSNRSKPSRRLPSFQLRYRTRGPASRPNNRKYCSTSVLRGIASRRVKKNRSRENTSRPEGRREGNEWGGTGATRGGRVHNKQKK